MIVREGDLTLSRQESGKKDSDADENKVHIDSSNAPGRFSPRSFATPTVVEEKVAYEKENCQR